MFYILACMGNTIQVLTGSVVGTTRKPSRDDANEVLGKAAHLVAKFGLRYLRDCKDCLDCQGNRRKTLLKLNNPWI